MSKKPQVGDRVEITVTGTVAEFINDEFGTSVYLKEGFGFDMSSPEVKVRKLARPKPKRGDIYAANDIRATMLKRGTMIRGIWKGAQPLVLAESGKWLFVGDISNSQPTTTFRNLTGQFEFLHVA